MNRLREEQHVNGVPHRLLDGYDGDSAPPPSEYIQTVLATAPEYIQERVAQVAKERAALDFGTLPPEEALRFRATDGMSASWLLIEHDGVLFRGPARGLPREVWSPRRRAFAPYTGGQSKPIDWGDIIGVDEALVLMSVRVKELAAYPPSPSGH